MSWLIIIIIGGIIGWIASIIMGANAQMGLLANIVVGIIGALLGRFIFFNLLGLGSAASAGAFSFFGILWGVIGAIILILILRSLNIFR